MTIFNSYSSKSRDLVEVLATDLDKLGYEVWHDTELTGGHKWWADILARIRACSVFLFAITQQSLDSEACKRELAYASSLGKSILPVMLSDVRISLLPRSLQETQLVNYQASNADRHFDLNRALRKLPPSPRLPDPLPPEPETPLPPTVLLAERVDQAELSLKDQQALVFEIEELLEDSGTADDARVLLERLSKRHDVYAQILRKIERLVGSSKNAISDAPFIVRGLTSPINLTPHTFSGHAHWVRSVAFSPNGRYVLTGSADTTARLWDASSGKELRQFVGHSDAVESVAFSPNGRYVLTGSDDKTARLWDVGSGKELRQFVGHNHWIWSVAFSLHSYLVLTGSQDNTARLWDASSGKELRQFVGHSHVVESVAFSPNGRYVLTGSADNKARLWDASSGKELRQFVGHSDAVESVAFSPDGQYILTGSTDNTARLWDVSGKELRQFAGHEESVFSVAFSPDGRYILTGSDDKTARLWDVSGKELHQFAGHEESVLSVAFSPDGHYILTGSADNTARLWAVDEE